MELLLKKNVYYSMFLIYFGLGLHFITIYIL